MHWGRDAVGRGIVRNLFGRSRLGPRSYQDSTQLTAEQQEQQLQSAGTLVLGQGQGQGRGRGRGGPLSPHFGTAGAPGQPATGLFGAGGNGQPAAPLQWSKGDPRGQALGVGWQAAGSWNASGNSAGIASVEPGWNCGPTAGRNGGRAMEGNMGAGGGQADFSKQPYSYVPSGQWTQQQNVQHGGGGWNSAPSYQGEVAGFPASSGNPRVSSPPASMGSMSAVAYRASEMGKFSGTVHDGMQRAAVDNASSHMQASYYPSVDMSSAGGVHVGGPSVGDYASSRGLASSNHSGVGDRISAPNVNAEQTGTGMPLFLARYQDASSDYSRFSDAQQQGQPGPVPIYWNQSAEQQAGFARSMGSASPAAATVSGYPQGSVPQRLIGQPFQGQDPGTQQLPGFLPTQGGPSHGLGPSQSAQGYGHSQWFGPSQGLQGFGPSPGLQGFGSSQGLQVFGTSQGPQGFGSSQGLQGLGSSQNVQGIGPVQNPHGPSQSPQGFGHSPSTQGFGPTQVPQGLGPMQVSQSFGPSQGTLGLGPSQGVSGFGPMQSPHVFGYSQGPQGFGPAQSPQGFGPTQSPQGFGPAQSPQGFGPAQSPQGFGSTHSPQGFGPTQSPQGFGHSLSAHGFGHTQDPQGLGPMQVSQGFGPSQGTLGFGPSHGTLGFGPSQVPLGFGHGAQGFGPSQGIQGIGLSQGIQGFGPSQVNPGFGTQFTQGFGPSQFTQGFGPAQGIQGFAPSQILQGFGPSQGQGFMPSQDPQGFQSSQVPLGFVPSQIQGPGYAHSQGLGFGPGQGLSFGSVQDQSLGPPQGQSFTYAQVQGQFHPNSSQVAQQLQPWNFSDHSFARKPEINVPPYVGQAAAQADHVTWPSGQHHIPGMLPQDRHTSQVPLSVSSISRAVSETLASGKALPMADAQHPKDYASLIASSFRQGLQNEVEVLFEEMKREKVPVQIATYNVLMEMYSRTGQLDKLDQIYKDMRQMAAGLGQSKVESIVSRSIDPSAATASAPSGQPSSSLPGIQDIFIRPQAPQSFSSHGSSSLSPKGRVAMSGPLFSDSVKLAESRPLSPQSSMPSVWTSRASMPAVEPVQSRTVTKSVLPHPVVEPFQSRSSESPKRSDWSPQVSIGRPLSPLPIAKPFVPRPQASETDILRVSSAAPSVTFPPVTQPVDTREQFSSPRDLSPKPLQFVKSLDQSLESSKPMDVIHKESGSMPVSPVFNIESARTQAYTPGTITASEPSLKSFAGDASAKAADGTAAESASGSEVSLKAAETTAPETPLASKVSLPSLVSPQDVPRDAVLPDYIPQQSDSKSTEREPPFPLPGLSLSPTRSGMGRGQAIFQSLSVDKPLGMSRGQVLPELSFSEQPRFGRGQGASVQPGGVGGNQFVPLSLFPRRPEVRPGLGRGRGKLAENTLGVSQFPPRLPSKEEPEPQQFSMPVVSSPLAAEFLKASEAPKAVEAPPLGPQLVKASQAPIDVEVPPLGPQLVKPSQAPIASRAPPIGSQPNKATLAPRMKLSLEEASSRAKAILLERAEKDRAIEREVIERRRQALLNKQTDDPMTDPAVERAMNILEQNLRKLPQAISKEEVEMRSKGKFDKFAEFTNVAQRRRAVPQTAQTNQSTTSRLRSDRRTERPTSLKQDIQPSVVQTTPEMELQDAEDAAKSALHQKFRMDFDPQYAMEDFGKNPDLKEMPLPTLEEALQEAKHLLMPLEGIVKEDDWQANVKEMLNRAPHLDKLVEAYAGPARITARQQNEQLELVAGKLPPHASPEITAFTQRALLTLQNNPSWRFAQKEQMMKNVVSGFSNY